MVMQSNLKPITTKEIIEEYAKGRRDFSNVRLNVSDLTGLNLSGIIFKNSFLKGVIFDRTNLTDSDFQQCEIEYGGFDQANLTRANFEKTSIKWTTMDETIFSRTNFKNSTLNWIMLRKVNLGGADFKNAKMSMIFRDWTEVTSDMVQEAEAKFEQSGLPIGFVLQQKSYVYSRLERSKKPSTTYPIGKKIFDSIKESIYSQQGPSNIPSYRKKGTRYGERKKYGQKDDGQNFVKYR